MTDLAHECARQIFDVTPTVIQAIRFEMRSLRLTDLTVPQFRTLAFINNHPGASLSDAAEFIGLTLSSMSILVNGLVERGLVQREPGLADRRRVHLSLTDAGLIMFRNVRTGTQDRLAEMVGELSDEQQLSQPARNSPLPGCRSMRGAPPWVRELLISNTPPLSPSVLVRNCPRIRFDEPRSS